MCGMGVGWVYVVAARAGGLWQTFNFFPYKVFTLDAY
jgi:hypothetical protein